MRRYFGSELHRFRVKPTVFMPALPPLFDLANLHRLLVGLSDGAGSFSGIGYLEHLPDEGGLRLISPVAEGPKALRLGSVRLEDDFRAKRVDLRNLFGSESRIPRRNRREPRAVVGQEAPQEDAEEET